MSEQHRDISVAEFFEKNRHLLGFSNKQKAVITCVKEGMDNALDACEVERILPEVHVSIEEMDGDKLRFQIKDNAVGIDREKIPKIFGKLLYGSKFHKLQQSLLPDQEIMVRREGEVRLMEIGELCDDIVGVEGGEKTKEVDEEIKAPCFDRETGEISWRPVTHAIRHKNRNETFKVETTRGREVEVTGNHSLFTLTEEGVEEVEASELGEGDYVLAPERIPSAGEISEINVLDYFTAEELAESNWYVYGISDSLLKSIEERGKKIRKRPSPDSRRRTYYRLNGVEILKDSLDNNYLKKNYLPADKILRLGWGNKIENGRLRTYQVGGKETEIPLNVELDEKFMRFLGLFVAEGHVDKRQAGLTFGSHEKELVQHAETVAGQTLNLSTTVSEREHNSVRLKVFGSPVVRLLEKLCGRGARNKHVPEFVFRVNEELQQAFIDGMYEGDGSDAHPSNELSYTTTSQRLARQLSYLWNMRGVVSSWKERVNSNNISGGETKTYSVLVHGRDIAKSDRFDEDANRGMRYRMIPSAILEDSRIDDTSRVRVKPNKSGIFMAAGLGSNPHYARKFVDKAEKILNEENVGEDYYLETFRKKGLVSEEGKPSDKLKEFMETVEDLLSFAQSDLCLLRVENVEETKSPEFVYDISVPGSGKDENFIGGNKGALCIKNSRGQQGIGISAAGLYSQLTTGNPVKIYSKKKGNEDTHMFKVRIDTQSNEPEIVEDRIVDDYEFDHGTSIEMSIEGKYTGGHHSVKTYLKNTAIMNPYAKIVLNEPDGNTIEFPRVSESLPPMPKEIKPHPHGVELGVLMRMVRNSGARTISSFLKSEFTRVGRTSADDIIEKAGLSGKERPSVLEKSQMEDLLDAMQNTNLQNPPTNCLSPIGEDLIERGLKKELNPDFVASVTRKPSVYRGNPYQVEVGIAYGGDIEQDGTYNALRYANKVPLIYKRSSCATTKAIRETDWSRYGLSESGNRPTGPVYILVHMASVWVPFTSEGKEAIADYPEIVKEMKLAVQEVGRKLKRYLSKKRKKKARAKKRKKLSSYGKAMSPALSKLTGVDDDSIAEKIMSVLREKYGKASTEDSRDEKNTEEEEGGDS
ncbi:MAG: DNA topoisomerase VI subunit B [Candidatus Nanohaloarchaea archaeon]|nr:DNA topoisomerase VI subunit B [Candidatus Nanohaloarchaea archaeon]